MLALMSGLDHFHVDFFLMGDVDGYYRFLAQERQINSIALPQPSNLLEETDWAIFIGDWIPYADLKAWLVEHAGFTSIEQDNKFHLRYDYRGCDAAVKVALIPFGELEMLDEHWWFPTGFGMTTNPNGIKIESLLGKSPVCPTPDGPVWQPIMLTEVMGQKLLSLNTEAPFQACREDAHEVSSLIENYEFLEHRMMFLFHNDVHLDEDAAPSHTDLQRRESLARILGRQMAFTMRGNESLYRIQSLVSEESIDDASLSETITMVMCRPRYYGDPTVLFNRETCRALFGAMSYGMSEDRYL